MTVFGRVAQGAAIINAITGSQAYRPEDRPRQCRAGLAQGKAATDVGAFVIRTLPGFGLDCPWRCRLVRVVLCRRDNEVLAGGVRGSDGAKDGRAAATAGIVGHYSRAQDQHPGKTSCTAPAPGGRYSRRS